MKVQEAQKRVVTLPKRKIFETPRLLCADAYTVGGNMFQSEKAKDKSTYYGTFRRQLHSVNPLLYNEGDDRMIFEGLGVQLEELFYEPITHAEIDITKEFLKTFKATAVGLTNYDFPEEMWRRVVDEYNGRPPIRIKAMPNGSVIYPNEPIMQITSSAKADKKMGELAAWFESTVLKVWATSERVTQNEHWLSKVKAMIRDVEGDEASEADIHFWSSLMLTDFGDRAAITNQETERLGMAHLYTFPGTDSCSGAYQAWENAGRVPVGSSVNALAHRNVQAYEFEGDCYKAIYEACGNNNYISMVSDCYEFYDANTNHLLPLALRSVEEGNGKVVVSRPDSGNAKEQVLWLCRLAVRNGLYTERTNSKGETWKYGTTLRFIEGDGMTWETMWEIIEALLEAGFAPHGWGLFGVGGGLRNSLKRDNTSAKYALCAKGVDDEGVVKFSDTLGKTTLPGPFKVLRSKIALENKQTVVFEHEDGEDAMVLYYDGSNIWEPFGVGQDDNFLDTRARIREQWDSMPLNLTSATNHNYPASDAILDERRRLLAIYAPKKQAKNY
jgi:nicotinamide phosphoribosyltransferase